MHVGGCCIKAAAAVARGFAQVAAMQAALEGSAVRSAPAGKRLQGSGTGSTLVQNSSASGEHLDEEVEVGDLRELLKQEARDERHRVVPATVDAQ